MEKKGNILSDTFFCIRHSNKSILIIAIQSIQRERERERERDITLAMISSMMIWDQFDIDFWLNFFDVKLSKNDINININIWVIFRSWSFTSAGIWYFWYYRM